MRASVSLRQFHRSTLVKLFAACLVVLSALPFTAPFSTFDKAEILGETAISAGHGTAKLIQEVTDLGWAPVSLPVLFSSAIWALPGWARSVDVSSHRSLVLRI